MARHCPIDCRLVSIVLVIAAHRGADIAGLGRLYYHRGIPPQQKKKTYVEVVVRRLGLLNVRHLEVYAKRCSKELEEDWSEPTISTVSYQGQSCRQVSRWPRESPEKFPRGPASWPSNVTSWPRWPELAVHNESCQKKSHCGNHLPGALRAQTRSVGAGHEEQFLIFSLGVLICLRFSGSARSLGPYLSGLLGGTTSRAFDAQGPPCVPNSYCQSGAFHV